MHINRDDPGHVVPKLSTLLFIVSRDAPEESGPHVIAFMAV
jgi:hypothetical protein